MFYANPNVLKNALRRVQRERRKLVDSHGPINQIRSYTDLEIGLRESLRAVNGKARHAEAQR